MRPFFFLFFLGGQLLPLLVTSLDLSDAGLRANVIDALTVLVKDVPSELENSINGITTKVLRGLTAVSGARDTPAEAASGLQVQSASCRMLILGSRLPRRNSASHRCASSPRCRRTSLTSSCTRKSRRSSRTSGAHSMTHGGKFAGPLSNVAVSGSCTPVESSPLALDAFCIH